MRPAAGNSGSRLYEGVFFFSRFSHLIYILIGETRTMDFSEHFTYRKLLRYAISPVIMMIFTSIYSVVDGLFLSNFAGKEAFAAVNFIMPYLMMFSSTGFMFGTGGSALIAKTLGEKKQKDANEIFSSLVWTSAITGVVLAVIGLTFLRPIASWLGAEGTLLENSVLYGRIYLLGMPACLIQFEFQNLYATAGKTKMGLYSTVASGMTNIVLDALFVGLFSWGIVGAAVATIVSQWIGGIIPFAYFGRENTSQLKLTKCRPNGRAMLKICTNGSSEMVNNISISIVSMLYNVQLLKYAGDDGIAAYGIMMYVNFLFTAIFWGYVVGTSPIISYHYGAGNHSELHSLLKKSLVIITSFSLIMFTVSEFLANPISAVFVGYDAKLLDITTHGFFLFSFCFIFSGLSIFGSSFFTALNNGLISAILSFSRVFVFQIPAILLLPLIWELDGVWISVVIAELCTAILGIIFILSYKKKYKY